MPCPGFHLAGLRARTANSPAGPRARTADSRTRVEVLSRGAEPPCLAALESLGGRSYFGSVDRRAITVVVRGRERWGHRGATRRRRGRGILGRPPEGDRLPDGFRTRPRSLTLPDGDRGPRGSVELEHADRGAPRVPEPTGGRDYQHTTPKLRLPLGADQLHARSARRLARAHKSAESTQRDRGTGEGGLPPPEGGGGNGGGPPPTVHFLPGDFLSPGPSVTAGAHSVIPL